MASWMQNPGEFHALLDAAFNFKYGLPLGLRNISSFEMGYFIGAGP
jgi:hypothetical protein